MTEAQTNKAGSKEDRTTQAANAQSQTEAQPNRQPAKPKKAFVLDTTAIEKPRVHDQIVNGQIQHYTFEPHKPLALPPEIAAKFLKEPAFKLVDEQGQPLAYKRQPKQPEELGAGEKLVLAEDQTIARFDELSTMALMQRTVELPGGEAFAQRGERPERGELVAFLIEAVKSKRAATKAAPDLAEDEFIPEAELGDEEAA